MPEIVEWSSELNVVWQTLNRDRPIEPLKFLRDSLVPRRRIQPKDDVILFGFDTNAILRIGLGKSGPDSVDYLLSRHETPLIIPGQAVQEIWNNQQVGLLPLPKVLQTKFLAFQSELEKIEIRLGSQGDVVKSAIMDLISQFPEVFDEESIESFQQTLLLLIDKGAVAYVPRTDFFPLARVRHETKTPPGFKDVGYGDFYIWADFLYGVAQCFEHYDAVVLVTNDLKSDWSRNGFAHPILSAEIAQITSKPFELWTLTQLAEYVQTRA